MDPGLFQLAVQQTKDYALFLLDPTGQELMCPLGHGSVYSSESVLGSEMSDRWLRLNVGGD